MPAPRPRPATLPPRTTRSDGEETRSHILQVAGRLFAEQGFERTTSRAICAAAGTNMAAVNYHFGGRDGLYDAVLVQAHGQLVQLDELQAIGQAGGSARTQIRALVSLFARRFSGNAPAWALQLLLRELMGPSTHVPTLIRQAVQPKIRVVMGLVAAVLGVPVEHPAVQRALVFVMMPCVMLVIAPREALHQALPLAVTDPDALVEDMTAYALAGLAAMGRQLKKEDARVRP